MAKWLDRFLAAIGAGRRKTEPDVSYDPTQKDQTADRTPGSGSSDRSV